MNDRSTQENFYTYLLHKYLISIAIRWAYFATSPNVLRTLRTFRPKSCWIGHVAFLCELFYPFQHWRSSSWQNCSLVLQSSRAEAVQRQSRSAHDNDVAGSNRCRGSLIVTGARMQWRTPYLPFRLKVKNLRGLKVNPKPTWPSNCSGTLYQISRHKQINQ